jgi:DNA repair exonuclease SbcCD ATPase subunit
MSYRVHFSSSTHTNDSKHNKKDESSSLSSLKRRFSKSAPSTKHNTLRRQGLAGRGPDAAPSLQVPSSSHTQPSGSTTTSPIPFSADDYEYQVGVLKEKQEKLLRTNNVLHVQLLEDTEAFEDKEREWAARLRTMQDKYEETEFRYKQTDRRVRAQEVELRELRTRLSNALSKRGALSGEAIDMSTPFPESETIPSLPSAPAPLHPNHEATLEAAATRIALLQHEVSELHKQSRNWRDTEAAYNAKLERRDAEIHRLAQSLEREQNWDSQFAEAEKADLKRYILGLQHQIDFVNDERIRLEAELPYKKRMAGGSSTATTAATAAAIDGGAHAQSQAGLNVYSRTESVIKLQTRIAELQTELASVRQDCDHAHEARHTAEQRLDTVLREHDEELLKLETASALSHSEEKKHSTPPGTPPPMCTSETQTTPRSQSLTAPVSVVNPHQTDTDTETDTAAASPAIPAAAATATATATTATAAIAASSDAPCSCSSAVDYDRIRQLASEVKNMTARAQYFESVYNTLRQQHAALSNTSHESSISAAASTTALEAQLNTLEEKLTDLVSARDDAQQQCVQARNEREQFATISARLEKQVEQLQDDVLSWQSRYEKCSDELERLLHEDEELAAESSSSTSPSPKHIKALQRQRAAMYRELEAVVQEKNTSVAQRDAVKIRHQQLVDEHQRLQAEDQRRQRELQVTKQQLKTVKAEAEGIKTLCTQVDAARVGAEKQVAELRAELQARSSKATNATAENKELQEALVDHKDEVNRLQTVIRRLDEEKDRMQGLLDEKAELLAEMSKCRENDINNASDTMSAYEATRKQVELLSKTLQQKDRDLVHLSQQLDALNDERSQLAGECSLKSRRLSEMNEDLSNMMKENQHVNGQFHRLSAERDELSKQLEAVTTKLMYTEELLRAKDSDRDDLLSINQAANKEIERLHHAFSEASQSTDESRAVLQTLQYQVAFLNSQINSKDAELQNAMVQMRQMQLENQEVARALAHAKLSLEKRESSSTVLERDMNSARYVSKGLEQKRSQLELALTNAHAHNHRLQMDLENARQRVAEAEGMITNAQSRETQLENLLAHTRHELIEFKQQHSNCNSHDDTASSVAQSKSRKLEAKIRSLTRQIEVC